MTQKFYLSSFPGPGMQFLDGMGRPLSGGHLYVYEGGTSTLSSVYAGSDGTSLPNPIPLDGGGRSPGVWFADLNLHDMALYDRHKQLITGYKGIQGLVTVLDNIDTRKYVRNYGAKGDGIHDDTDALQAAFNAISALNGDTLFFGGGTFLVRKKLEFTSRRRVILEGGQGTIKMADGATVVYGDPILNIGRSSTVVINDLHTDGNRATRTFDKLVEAPNIKMTQSSRVYINRCEVLNYVGYGVSVEAKDQKDKVTMSQSVRIRDCHFENGHRDCILVRGAVDVQHHGCTADNIEGKMMKLLNQNAATQPNRHILGTSMHLTRMQEGMVHCEAGGQVKPFNVRMDLVTMEESFNNEKFGSLAYVGESHLDLSRSSFLNCNAREGSLLRESKGTGSSMVDCRMQDCKFKHGYVLQRVGDEKNKRGSIVRFNRIECHKDSGNEPSWFYTAGSNIHMGNLCQGNKAMAGAAFDGTSNSLNLFNQYHEMNTVCTNFLNGNSNLSMGNQYLDTAKPAGKPHEAEEVLDDRTSTICNYVWTSHAINDKEPFVFRTNPGYVYGLMARSFYKANYEFAVGKPKADVIHNGNVGPPIPKFGYNGRSVWNTDQLNYYIVNGVTIPALGKI